MASQCKVSNSNSALCSLLCSEIFFTIGNIRKREFLTALSHFTCIFIWCWGFRKALKFREIVAGFSNQQLTSFLCNNVLVGGIGAMVPMAFFSFETVSCLAEEGFENGLCENTSTAAAFLSVNLVAFMSFGLINKAQRRQVQIAAALSYERLATLDLRRRQIFQGLCLVTTGIGSLFLLSNIGIVQARQGERRSKGLGTLREGNIEP